MTISTLHDLLTVKIMALYDIETQIVKALPKMAKAATDPGLKKAFANHLEETEKQVERLEEIFEALGMKAKKMKVEAIRGLIEDTEWCIKEKPSPNLLDALLIASARYVEHYEMAGYLSAITWAEKLDLEETAELLRETLEEEKAADALLEEGAVANMNEMLAADEDSTEEEDDE
jgi:ferritin-like metal-binding protein YciE